MASEYIWLDSRGAVIVNPEGQPYLSESCCCCDCCSGGSNSICYHNWTASCVDDDGKPVYGPGGTGKRDEEHWTTPVQTGYGCGPSGGGPVDQWILDAPGSAHYRQVVDVGGRCTDKKCKAEADPPPAPDIPCICAKMWGHVEVEPPNYTLAFPVVGRDIYSITYDEHGEPEGSEFVSQDVVPLWEADDLDQTQQNALDYKVGAVYNMGFRVVHYYLHDFVAGALDEPEGFCPAEGAEYDAWSRRRHAANHDSYEIRTGRRTYAEAPPGAPGQYWPLPPWPGIFLPGSGIRGATSDYNNLMYLQDDALMSADFGAFAEHGKLLWGVGAADPLRDSVEYPIVYEPGWTATFGDNMWGYIEVSQPSVDIDAWPGASGSIILLREARGASCAKQDVPVEVNELAAGQTSGYPMWHFRTYVLTDAKIADVNAANMAYARHQPFPDYMSQYSKDNTITVHVRAQGLFCPMYYVLYVSEEWPFCVPDPARPLPLPPVESMSPPPAPVPVTDCDAFCAPIRVVERVVSCWEPNPLPYFASGLVPPNTGGRSTYWLHETAEQPMSGLPGLRKFSAAIDGHCYKAVVLNIDNFPTWYQQAQCDGPVDAEDYEAPICEFNDYNFYCEHCTYPDIGPDAGAEEVVERDCCWPGNNRCISQYTNDCGWRTVYSAIGALEYNKPGLGPENDTRCLKCAAVCSRIIVKQEPKDDPLRPPDDPPETIDVSYVDMDDWWTPAEAGCPDWNWTWALVVKYVVSSECKVWFNNDPNNSQWWGMGTSYEYAVTWDSEYMGNLTWEGNPDDPRSCMNMAERLDSIYVGPADYAMSWQYDSTSEHRSKYVDRSAIVAILQFPPNVCDGDQIDGGDAPTELPFDSETMSRVAIPCAEQEEPEPVPAGKVLGPGTLIIYTAFGGAYVVEQEHRYAWGSGGPTPETSAQSDYWTSGSYTNDWNWKFECSCSGSLQASYVLQEGEYIPMEEENVFSFTVAARMPVPTTNSGLVNRHDLNRTFFKEAGYNDHTMEELLSYYGDNGGETSNETTIQYPVRLSRVSTVNAGWVFWMTPPPDFCFFDTPSSVVERHIECVPYEVLPSGLVYTEEGYEKNEPADGSPPSYPMPPYSFTYTSAIHNSRLMPFPYSGSYVQQPPGGLPLVSCGNNTSESDGWIPTFPCGGIAAPMSAKVECGMAWTMAASGSTESSGDPAPGHWGSWYVSSAFAASAGRGQQAELVIAEPVWVDPPQPPSAQGFDY